MGVERKTFSVENWNALNVSKSFIVARIDEPNGMIKWVSVSYSKVMLDNVEMRYKVTTSILSSNDVDKSYNENHFIFKEEFFVPTAEDLVEYMEYKDYPFAAFTYPWKVQYPL